MVLRNQNSIDKEIKHRFNLGTCLLNIGFVYQDTLQSVIMIFPQSRYSTAFCTVYLIFIGVVLCARVCERVHACVFGKRKT